MTAPILILGASRSGTGLLARMLHENGVFMGADLESNYESKSRQHLNKWIMGNAGASLETPEAMDALLADAFARDAVTQIVAVAPLRAYWGWRRWWRPPTWGFKDPRTTFTLPIWLDVYPDAKVIHVLRHGIDAAQSLVTRRRRVEQGWAQAVSGRPMAVRRLDLITQQRVVANVRARTFAGAFAHWQTYVTHASAQMAALGRQGRTVRYEALVRDPVGVLRELATFLAHDLDRVPSDVEPTRAFAHRTDQVTSGLADAHAVALARWGY